MQLCLTPVHKMCCIFYRTDGNGATVHQLGNLVPFDDCYFTEALRTVHFTV